MVNHILSIGIDSYTNISKLNNCVRDIDNILDVLTGMYDFEKSNVTKLVNTEATEENIISKLEDYFANQNSGDNILILFSGHGEFDNKLDLGYLLPVECIIDKKSTYIPNTTVFNYIKAFEYRHVVFISDTCFSGSIFSQYKGLPTANEKLYEIPSKWALTSGRLEKVSDGAPGANSPFADSILNSLKGNNKSLFSISELTRMVTSKVAETHQQIPRGAPLQILGDKGGEFSFKLKTSIKSVNIATPSIILNESLKSFFKEYYSTLEKIEEAENQNKVATVRRLNEELQYVGNVIAGELLKTLQFEKTKLLTANKKADIDDSLGGKYEQLRSIKIVKNELAKTQKFEAAADAREKEKQIQREIFDLIIIEGSLSKTLKLEDTAIEKDFAILSTVSDLTILSGRFEITKLVEDSFISVLFIKLSRDYGFITEFRFQAKFAEFKNRIVPILSHLVSNSSVEDFSTSKSAIYESSIFKDLLNRILSK